ncbi:MAG TPA: CpsB/CapC family capsule biosynthesis tyrosine phosphatase [Gemmatimonadales bacterium]|nr:CpsB/CapC family capsule biosynthesis tyrosine phosphatase [Gemmatimonadales bacterium]
MIPLADLHSHLVPGVDDGAASLDEALDSLRHLRAEGVTALVTTPHLLLPRLSTDAAIGRELERHRRAFDLLLDATEGASDLPAVALGQEIWAPDAAAIRRVASRADVGFGGGDVLLVEFGFVLKGTHEDVIEAARAAGRRIVIAHPERYRFVSGMDPLETAAAWRGRGAEIQINAGSLTGHYADSAPGSESLSWRLIDAGLADLISTDHHGTRREGVSPREARTALLARNLREAAERLLSTNPGRIVRAALESAAIRSA